MSNTRGVSKQGAPSLFLMAGFQRAELAEVLTVTLQIWPFRVSHSETIIEPRRRFATC
jgi:hypothetical protein